MQNFFQDIRFALRGMRKSPGFAVVAVITLALGIGANTAIFTVVNAVFFHSIPVRDPEHLLEIFTVDQRKDLLANTTLFPSSYPNGEDIRQRAQSFSGVTIDSASKTARRAIGKYLSGLAATVRIQAMPHSFRTLNARYTRSWT